MGADQFGMDVGLLMNYLSVCSGIEAATVAWHDMGWKPIGFSEIEAVLILAVIFSKFSINSGVCIFCLTGTENANNIPARVG